MIRDVVGKVGKLLPFGMFLFSYLSHLSYATLYNKLHGSRSINENLHLCLANRKWCDYKYFNC